LFHDTGFACVTEDIVKETLNKNVSVPFKIFSQQESKYALNSISKCCRSLFVTVTVYRQPDASLSHSKTLSQIHKHQGLFYRLRFRFLGYIKMFCIPNFHNLLYDGLLVTGVQQLEEIFSFHSYEFSFVVYIIGFRVKGYSMRNNKIGENSGDFVLIFW
jgi:hypothetical protein